MQRLLLRRWPRSQARRIQLQRTQLSLRSCHPGVSSASGGARLRSAWMPAGLRGGQRLAPCLQLHSRAQSQHLGCS